MIKEIKTIDWNDTQTNNLIGKSLEELFFEVKNNSLEMHLVEQESSKRALGVFLAKGENAGSELQKITSELNLEINQNLDESKQIPLFDNISVETVKNENIYEICKIMNAKSLSSFFLRLADKENEYFVVVLTDSLAKEAKDLYQENILSFDNSSNEAKMKVK